MTAYDLDLYFFRRYKLKIRTGTQYTTHVLKKQSQISLGKSVQRWTKKGKENQQERTGLEQLTES